MSDTSAARRRTASADPPAAATRLQEHVLARFRQEGRGLHLVEDRKASRDIRLEGKLLQQAFAEGVDRLDA